MNVEKADTEVSSDGNKVTLTLDGEAGAVFMEIYVGSLDPSKLQAPAAQGAAQAQNAPPQQDGETRQCPDCGSPMKKREGFSKKDGKPYCFWGCTAWRPNNAGCNKTVNG